MSPGAACCGDIGGIGDPFATVYPCAHLATLRHFDHKVMPWAKTGPLIPCERRLAIMEFPENQEVTFGGRFENGDYDRPYRHILVTLRGFD